MKIKHNKKRNTAFVYEALIVEATVAILKKDLKRQNKASNLIKKYFQPGSTLRKDLECYRSLYEEQNLDKQTSKRIVQEAKLQQKLLDPEKVFGAQTDLIHDINKELSSSVFANFVPNYKSLATIGQLFSDRTSPKSLIILENRIINDMQKSDIQHVSTDLVDGIVYKAFVEKFNSKYEQDLLTEQKELLTHYISSFADNALGLKVFLNEEIARLKLKLNEALEIQEIKNDLEMCNKAKRIIEHLNTFAKQDFNDEMLLTVLKTQSLVKEIYSNAD
tara:strand:+ start:357 stop:1184 length:828 start_codon:yes stop_codon:yes gene_type:complete